MRYSFEHEKINRCRECPMHSYDIIDWCNLDDCPLTYDGTPQDNDCPLLTDTDPVCGDDLTVND